MIILDMEMPKRCHSCKLRLSEVCPNCINKLTLPMTIPDNCPIKGELPEDYDIKRGDK